MATTEYQIICRYYNTDMSKCVTNLTTSEWSSSNSGKQTASKEIFKFYTGYKSDGKTALTEEEKAAALQDLQSAIIEGNRATNPKFDMLFVYDGRDVMYSTLDGKLPYVLTDKMDRIKISPWFVHSTYGALSSAMLKAQELIKWLGKDNVRIGKVVPLEQYIDIV